MMVFSSIYGVVDGVFVSNFVGAEAFRRGQSHHAVSDDPGSGRLHARHRRQRAGFLSRWGRAMRQRANEIFSMLIYVLIGLGAVFTVGGDLAVWSRCPAFWARMRQCSRYCVSYGRIVLAALDPLHAAKYLSELSGHGGAAQLRPVHHRCRRCVQHGSGRAVYRRFQAGAYAGAALATSISQCIGGMIPLLYFTAAEQKQAASVPRRTWMCGALVKACTNGASEFMTNISMSRGQYAV